MIEWFEAVINRFPRDVNDNPFAIVICCHHNGSVKARLVMNFKMGQSRWLDLSVVHLNWWYII